MGVKDMSTFLKRIGHQTENLILDPGSVVLLDAMIILISHHANAVNLFISQNSHVRKELPLAMNLELMTTGMERMPETEIFDANNNLIPTAFARPDPPPPWICIREQITLSMTKLLASYLSAGVIPILVWDPPIVGGSRTPGKIQRASYPLVLRNVDKIYIYAALRYAGFPTMVAWTEGEKVACAAVQAGVGHAVVSSDSDCLVLGSSIVATSAVPIVAGGVMLSGVSTHQTLTTTFSKLLGRQCSYEEVHKRLIDVAVFLGCDFCERIHRNGPAAMVKRICSNSGPFADEALKSMDLEYVERVKRTLDFFEITDADRENAADLVKCALKFAWEPNLDVLEGLSILARIEPYLAIIRRGCPTVRDVEVQAPITSGAQEY